VRSRAVGIACVAFVALACVSSLTPRNDVSAASAVVVDQQGVVVSVDPASEAWQTGVRPGWLLIGTDPKYTYYGDRSGDIRPIANGTQASGSQIGEVVPAIAALAFAALFVAIHLRRTGMTAAVLGSALGSPVLAARLGPAGGLIALAPVGIGAGLAWTFGTELGFRRPAGPAAGTLGRFAIPFVALPLAASAAAFGWMGVVAAAWAGAAVYVGLAWVLVLRWRVGIARARLGRQGTSNGNRPDRFTVARTVVADMLPFSDRIRRGGAEAERTRLAGDLHAELLPAIAMTASELERRGAKDEAERVRGLASSVRDLVSERRLPVLEEQGLVPATEWLAESIQDSAGITIEIGLDGWDGVRQPKAVEHAAYRVLQLALDNVVRHSGAASAWVQIRGTADSLRLSIEDDGSGIGRPDTGRPRVHLGIVDMRAEADAIGASLVVEPRSPKGTRVEMRWRA
jgi:signal transduction histidine kinase